MILLEDLKLADNRLKCLPKNIGNLKNLENLDLYYNRLKSLPTKFCELDNLEQLNLYANKLKSVPKALKSLKKIEFISLDGNDIIKEQIEILKNELPNCEVTFERKVLIIHRVSF